MNNIPPKLRAEIAADPFYQRCCITGAMAKNTKIEWHHNLIFAGKQVQEKWAILPLVESVHDDIAYHKEECDCKEMIESFQPWYGFTFYHSDDCAIVKHIERYPQMQSFFWDRDPKVIAQSE